MSDMIIKESPLKGMCIGAVDTVSIHELQGLHTIDLRVTPGTLAQAAIEEALDIHLPKKSGQASVSSGDKTHALCLAPDWWLIVEYAEAVQKLTPLKSQHHFSIVDVSGQRTTIELEGPKVHEILAQVWEQDLREKSFPVGSTSQGLMAKAPVIVWHIAPFCYRVMVRSSFALHLWKVLADAAEEWV
jgi:sarcosine oxidase, subunit gamma